jgi:hypothetical protein
MASATEASAFALEAGKRPIGIRTFAGYVALAGMGNAVIAAYLISRLPPSAPTLRSLLVRALIYVAGAALVGLGGARFYWNRSSTPFRFDPPLSFRLFALVDATAWVWAPSIVLLSRRDSPASVALSALGAALLANGLRRILPSADSPHLQDRAPQPNERELFASTLYTAPREAHGYVIALCLYVTGYLLIGRFYLIAGAPLALAAFLFAWKLTLEPAPANDNSRPALRLVAIAAAAVLVTFCVLDYGIDHYKATNLARVPGKNGGGDASNRRGTVKTSGISGFESIILWPVPEKRQIVAPRPADISPFATRTAKPLVVHFDGAYWYFQPPDKRPGPNAHRARGSPLAVDIGANNNFPLNMEAVQSLSASIRIVRYREIQVAIENRDNISGVVSVGVLLTDSSVPAKPSLSLASQPVLTSAEGQLSFKSAPTEEVLRFPVPEHTTIRRFDRITLFFLPDLAHFEVGPKIAIQQFAFIPR